MNTKLMGFIAIVNWLLILHTFLMHKTIQENLENSCRVLVTVDILILLGFFFYKFGRKSWQVVKFSLSA